MEILALAILAVTNIATLIFHYFSVREAQYERAKLLNALVSKTPEQFRDLELNGKPAGKTEPQEPDLVATENLTDEEFIKTVVGDNEPA